MSFLNVTIPAESVDQLLDDIREQLLAGRFAVDLPGFHKVVERPTIELKRLIEIIQRELQVRIRYLYTLIYDQGWKDWLKDQINKKAGLIPYLVKVERMRKFSIGKPVVRDGSCFLVCLQEFENGGAFWTDLTRKHALDRNTILKCDEGCIEAEAKGSGGIYLMLVNKFSN